MSTNAANPIPVENGTFLVPISIYVGGILSPVIWAKLSIQDPTDVNELANAFVRFLASASQPDAAMAVAAATQRSIRLRQN